MSTRRARIKAVAALPPRRKNIENDAKEKVKDGYENGPKTPRTPRRANKKNEEKNSPSLKELRTPPSVPPINTGSKTPVTEKVSSPIRIDTAKELPKDTLISEKVPVITPVPPLKNVFASPQVKASPDRRWFGTSIFSPLPKPSKTTAVSATAVISSATNDSDITLPRPPKMTGVSATRVISSASDDSDIPLSKPPKTIGVLPSPGISIASDDSDIPIPKRSKTTGVSASAVISSASDDHEIPLPKQSKTTVVSASPVISRASDDSNIPSLKPSKTTGVPTTPVISSASNESDKSRPTNASRSNDKVNSTPKGDKKSDIPDDYNVPSVPESVTDETVMDGIVPLQAAKNAPKPIDMLKNEIISEYAEVSFDPIVPLPSPSKVRPKLRPVPRLAPHRRNSIQGSASESEDESRRALLSSGAPTPLPPRQRHDSHTPHSTLHAVPNKEINRIRNDSVCSNVSQITASHPPPATSPVKEKHFSKTRRQEMNRRPWLRRREVKRDALTMYDLIFYNPTTNPIIPDQDEISAKEANAKEEAKRTAKEAAESEEEADDPPVADAAPVPQIKLGPNGEIVLDEKSLVIKQSDNRKVSSVVREGAWAGGSGRYSRTPRTAEWSAAETVRFYRALGAIGTDFSLMAPLFPGRTRRDLYLKFKKEERLNGAQVDKALRSATSWDAERLQDEFKQERADAAKRAESDHQRFMENKRAERDRIRNYKEMRFRNSKGARAVESTVGRGAGVTELRAEDFAKRAMEQMLHKPSKSTRKKSKSNFIPPKAPKVPKTPPPSNFATLTLLGNGVTPQQNKSNNPDMATISKIDPNILPTKPVSLNEVSGVPSNIETGSLVVLRVNDPSSPSKTMLQTYIAHGAGKLTPVALPPTFLNSVVGYMKKGTPKSTRSTASSPQLTSPSSVASQDSRSCTPSVIQLNPSPAKRSRHTSFTITPL